MSQNDIAVSLGTMARGAVAERFEKLLQDAVTNILDPNTDLKERVITIKVRMKPNDARDSARVGITHEVKFSSFRQVETTFYVGTVHGEPKALEYNPRQTVLPFDSVVAGADDEGKGKVS